LAPTEFPVKVTVQESPEHKLPAVHVVECVDLSYVQEVVPQLKVTVLALIVKVAVFEDGKVLLLLLRPLAVTVAVPLLAPTEFPVSVTVHESPEHKFPAVQVVE
jgi:hypothetical protein